MTKYKVIGSFNLFFGIIQIFYPLIAVLFIIPKANVLGTRTPSDLANLLMYISFGFIALVGIANFIISWNLFRKYTPNKEVFLKVGLFMLALNVLSADLPSISTGIIDGGHSLSKPVDALNIKI